MKENFIKGVFSIAVFLFFIGQVITFVPGQEMSYYLILSIALILPSFFFSKKKNRIFAIIFLVLSIAYTVYGYKRGIEYKAFLKEKQEMELSETIAL